MNAGIAKVFLPCGPAHPLTGENLPYIFVHYDKLRTSATIQKIAVSEFQGSNHMSINGNANVEFVTLYMKKSSNLSSIKL